MTHFITREDIDNGERITHRVVVRFFNGERNIIAAVVEGFNPVRAYQKARKLANVKGRVPVEYLPKVKECNVDRFH